MIGERSEPPLSVEFSEFSLYFNCERSELPSLFNCPRCLYIYIYIYILENATALGLAYPVSRTYLSPVLSFPGEGGKS